MLIVGIVIFALGILLSIAWHELGHFLAARRFGIRVPEFMVGFGPRLFSLRRGETEFGVKAVPFGGYIRMVGMIPPAPGERIGRSRRSGMFQGMIDDIRAESERDFRPGDETRQFWTRKPWQRIIVMFAGPFMNLVLAVGLFAVVLMGIGVQTATTTVDTVYRCAVPVQAGARPPSSECPPGAPPAPAFGAGLRPGDRIVSFGGRPYSDWNELLLAIRGAGGPTPLVVDRGGTQVPLTVDVLRTQVEALDGNGTEPGGFVGLTTSKQYVSATPGQVVTIIGGLIDRTAEHIVALPTRVPDLFGAVFLGEQRDQDSPVSVVGASVIGGQILERNYPVLEELALMLQLLAGVNLSLFLLNLLPILPLDGGHILPALWEATKKRIARMRGRPDPGPADLARLMPIAQGFAILIIGYGVLVIAADIVNPIAMPF